MYKHIVAALLLAAIFTTACSQDTASPGEAPVPPVAKKIPHQLSAHNDTRVDNYYWMRDDTRTDPEVLAHLHAENAYTRDLLAPIAPLKETIYEELVGRLEKDDSTVPVYQNGYWYYRRFSGDMEYPLYARKQKLSDDEEILLDGNTLAAGHDYFNIGDYSVSTNNRILAYSTDTLSRRIYTIEFTNLETGDQYADKLTGTSGQMIWANDNETVYYIYKDPQTLLGYQVFRHRLGTSQEDDTLVYQEDNTSFYTYLGKSKDREIVYVFHSSTTSSSVSLLDANNSTANLHAFLPLEADHEYSVAKLGNVYYIRTNWNAVNFRLMKVGATNSANKAAWQEVLPHREDVFLEDFTLFEDHLVAKEKINGQSTATITQLSTGKKQALAFDDQVYIVDLYSNPELGSDYLRVYYSSPTTPSSIIDISLADFGRELKKQDKVLGGYIAAEYAAERIFVTARDGKNIPVTLLYRRDNFSKDGSNPLYQYGYGSYGYTKEPYFNSNWLSLTDRGFVVAVAHIRGSQMLGRPWYEDGKLLNKKNSFTDFIDVTRGLVAQKYGDGDKVYAEGGSAGGLLMGAVMNMAPTDYDGIAAHVPFVDVITTMSDPSIPLTTTEYDEWGNPANAESYSYMLSYSPYDQVAAIEYPNTLVTAGLHDSQVQYFEPMKWVAKLREMKSGDNVLLFKVNMEAGHGGSSGRFKRLQDKALTYAFFIDLASQ